LLEERSVYLALLLARLTLTAVFLIAALSKVLGGFANSRKALADFGVPRWLVAPASISLPVVELGTAFLLLPADTARIGALSALVLLLIFNVAIAANLALGRTPDCNCFGQLHSEPIGWRTFARNGVLLALAGWVTWRAYYYPSPSVLQAIQRLNGREIAVAVVAVIAFAAIGAEALIMLQFLRQNGRLLLRIEALEARLASVNLGATNAALPIPPRKLPLGSPAPSFELPNVQGGTATLRGLLGKGKALLLVFSSPNCGPCSALMPDIARWQSSLAGEVTIVLISDGRHDVNRAKAAEHHVKDVLVEKKRNIAEKYNALGTPTAIVVRQNGAIGSYPVGGADAIRQLVTHKGWTEGGFSVFLKAVAQPQPPAAKPALRKGTEAPEFMLPDLAGQAVNLAALGGRPTVLLFWNVACGFCQRMLPQLVEWERTNSTSSPGLVLISSSSREMNSQMGLKSTVLLDEQFAVGTLYGAGGTPSAVLIDADGKIASSLMVGGLGVMELLEWRERPVSAEVALASAS
jgi:peroxiredoxin